VEPILGQIQTFAFNFAPVDWCPCDGRLLEIQQFTALYQLLGTRYGGDGQNTFGIPKIPPIAPQGPGYYICILGEFPQ
jgi:microcystin-dependent protein